METVQLITLEIGIDISTCACFLLRQMREILMLKVRPKGMDRFHYPSVNKSIRLVPNK